MTTTVLPTFNTRMSRASTYTIPRTIRDASAAPVDLTGAKVYWAMRADIKIAPSVQLCSESTTLASLQLGGLGNRLIDTVVTAKTPPGTAVTVALIGDAIAKAGTIDDGTSNVALHYLPGSSLVSDMETLITGSSHLGVLVSGSLTTQVLDAGSAFSATGLLLPASGYRVGVVINPDQNSFRGQYVITLIPSDTSSLAALGDSDPWIHEAWIKMRDGSVIPDFTVSSLGLYQQAVILP